MTRRRLCCLAARYDAAVYTAATRCAKTESAEAGHASASCAQTELAEVFMARRYFSDSVESLRARGRCTRRELERRHIAIGGGDLCRFTTISEERPGKSWLRI